MAEEKKERSLTIIKRTTEFAELLSRLTDTKKIDEIDVDPMLPFVEIMSKIIQRVGGPQLYTRVKHGLKTHIVLHAMHAMYGDDKPIPTADIISETDIEKLKILLKPSVIHVVDRMSDLL